MTCSGGCGTLGRLVDIDLLARVWLLHWTASLGVQNEV